jgi:hypothetical protein
LYSNFIGFEIPKEFSKKRAKSIINHSPTRSTIATEKLQLCGKLGMQKMQQQIYGLIKKTTLEKYLNQLMLFVVSPCQIGDMFFKRW